MGRRADLGAVAEVDVVESEHILDEWNSREGEAKINPRLQAEVARGNGRKKFGGRGS